MIDESGSAIKCLYFKFQYRSIARPLHSLATEFYFILFCSIVRAMFFCVCCLSECLLSVIGTLYCHSNRDSKLKWYQQVRLESSQNTFTFSYLKCASKMRDFHFSDIYTAKVETRFTLHTHRHGYAIKSTDQEKNTQLQIYRYMQASTLKEAALQHTDITASQVPGSCFLGPWYLPSQAKQIPIFSPKYSRMWSSGWYLCHLPHRAQQWQRTWRGFSIVGSRQPSGYSYGPWAKVQHSEGISK